MLTPTRRPRVILALLILSGALWRCYRIDEPLFDNNYTRQYVTADIARNFAEGDMNILYPQVSWGGDSPGYVEMEFPLYNFLVAGLYRLFGIHEWLGRALNIFFWALASLLLFKFAQRWADQRTALFAVFFYAFVPMSFISRNFQPEMLMCLCALAAVYWFWLWSEQSRSLDLVCSGFLLALALLVKIPSAHMGVPLLYLSWRRFGWNLLRRWELWAYGFGVFVPAVLWYGHARQLGASYGNSFQGVYLLLGYPGFSDPIWQELFTKIPRRLVVDMATPAGLILLAAGGMARPVRQNALLRAWALGFGITVLLFPWGFGPLDYYLLPALFIMAVWMGRGAVLLWDQNGPWLWFQRAGVITVCVSVGVFSIWLMNSRTRLRDADWVRAEFARRVEQLTERDDRLVFLKAFQGRPEYRAHRFAAGQYLCSESTDFYLARRKGWCVDHAQLNPVMIEALRARGARYFATAFPLLLDVRQMRAYLDQEYVIVEVTPSWAIYRLDPRAGPQEKHQGHQPRPEGTLLENALHQSKRQDREGQETVGKSTPKHRILRSGHGLRGQRRGYVHGSHPLPRSLE